MTIRIRINKQSHPLIIYKGVDFLREEETPTTDARLEPVVGVYAIWMILDNQHTCIVY
ncbi:hypothetical protein SAMN04487909_1118 [Aneurinibacillus migulanus]|uniref:Uncharacterized protein n=1 Tax=Aneurinibacillus migulanus TaxID=47500 RepID=A0A1G8QK76_ANEMI|nr:hypothetical protein AMI01nite_14600 [Aneurinibacillus migulanus]SDJ04795.1 hypothetical protein SAMN04487909_1118 [Aneurinibacillus migulanus]